MDAPLKSISIMLLGLLLITSCGEKAEDGTISTENEDVQTETQSAEEKARLAAEAERLRAASYENVPNDYYAIEADGSKAWVDRMVPELTEPSNFKTEAPLCKAIHQNEMMTYSNINLALLFKSHNIYSAMVSMGRIQACPNITQTPQTVDFIQREHVRQVAISILFSECYKGSIGTDAQERFIAEQSKNMPNIGCEAIEATAKSYVVDTLRYPTNVN